MCLVQAPGVTAFTSVSALSCLPSGHSSLHFELALLQLMRDIAQVAKDEKLIGRCCVFVEGHSVSTRVTLVLHYCPGSGPALLLLKALVHIDRPAAQLEPAMQLSV